MNEPASKPGLGWRLLRWLLRQCENCLALIGLLTLIYLLCFDLSVMTSPSMAPTRQGTSWRDGDHVLTEKVSYRLRRPARWEVIRIHREDGVKVMKRVVGLPGETVQIREDGRIVIDGSLIDPPDGFDCPQYKPQCKLMDGAAVDCGRGYFVLGDDTIDSDDSRYTGPVPPEEIMGRAWLIVAPWPRVGFINP